MLQLVKDDGLRGLELPLHGSGGAAWDAKKARGIPGFETAWGLLLKGDPSLPVAEAGLEPAQGLLPEGF